MLIESKGVKFKAPSKIKQNLMSKIYEQCNVLELMCGHHFFLKHIQLPSKVILCNFNA